MVSSDPGSCLFLLLSLNISHEVLGIFVQQLPNNFSGQYTVFFFFFPVFSVFLLIHGTQKVNSICKMGGGGTNPQKKPQQTIPKQSLIADTDS